MTDRPIIFSAPMVRALLDGRKTQTRRILGGRGRNNIFEPGVWSDDYVLDPGNAEWRAQDTPYAVGDHLYVREAHALVPMTAYRASTGVEQTINPHDPDEAAIYAVDWERSKPRWRPSIHMPRWASRLTLNVTEVRVQRLNEISGEDAEAEGVFRHVAMHSLEKVFRAERHSSAISYFADLWRSLHGAESWDANPWIVAVTFAVEHSNIDQIRRAA